MVTYHCSVADILPSPTSHGMGEKRVLLAGGETLTDITQIAVTRLKAGEASETHRHPTMEEFFFFREGKAVVCIEGQEIACERDMFVRVPADTPHSLRAVTDVEVLTIGCAIKNDY